MLIEKIIEIQKLNFYREEDIYLISVVNSDAGFLLHKNRVLFIIRNVENLDNDSVNTTLLSLKTNVYINSIENNPSFNPDYYNVLIFNENYTDELFDTYVDLCCLYTKTQKKKSFTDFFYELINLFQLPKETKFNNFIGLFGELSLIIDLHKNFQINVADKWHISGSSFDKYDFCFKKFNVEVKTTIKEENIFRLKHQQVFNESNNYIVVINIEENISGVSLENIYNYFRKNESFSNDIDFQIKLAEEKRRIDFARMQTKKYSVVSYKVYFNKDLESITKIPTGLYELEYKYDFSNRKEIDFSDFYKMLASE